MTNINVPSFIKNYLELEDNISNDQIKILENLFSKIKDNEVTSSNVIYDNNIEDGIKLVPKKKNKTDNIDSDITKQLLNFINNELNNSNNNANKILFNKAFISLIENSNYISSKEQIVLNFLFDKLNYYDKELVISDENKFAIKRKEKKK